MPPVGSFFLPKILVAVFTLGIFYELFWQTPTSISRSSHDNPNVEWFQDALPPDVPKPDALKPNSDYSQDTSTTERPALDYTKTHISYGSKQCMRPFDEKLKQLAIERHDSCTKHAPFSTRETRRVALATGSAGKAVGAYQGAIQTQMFHSAVHNTSTHILCEQLAAGTWNKIAFLSNLVMNEMLKPPKSRLEWIMWLDRDAIILDTCRPLSSFLPPNTSDFEHVNFLATHDALGFNSGAFSFRVNDWSRDFFNSVLAFPYFRPHVKLAHDEQSAMQLMILEEKWRRNVTRVPWYWFNAYPEPEMAVDKFKDGAEVEWFRARKGDFAVHFAGDKGREGKMPGWLDMLEEVGNVWATEGDVRDITEEIKEYWRSYKKGELTYSKVSGKPRKKD